MDTNLYWNVRGTYSERIAKLEQADPTWLRACLLDKQYNDFLGDRADYKQDEDDPRGHGKRLPYIGWYWRHLDFHSGYLPLGNACGTIGFMANNKWGYPERDTTPDEFAAIMEIVDAAMQANQQGGNLAEIIEQTNKELDRLWGYLQTLTVE